MKRLRCWLRGYHDHASWSLAYGPVYAPPCRDCGAENPAYARALAQSRVAYPYAPNLEDL